VLEKKRNGFWHFAFAFQDAMINDNSSLYTDMWNNMTEEAQQKWGFPSLALINHEFRKLTYDDLPEHLCQQ